MPRVDKLDLTRVAIIGGPGSGKSTLGIQLSQLLGRQVVHLDAHIWQPNWTLPSKQAVADIHQSLILSDSWIIEGTWRSLIADRAERATCIIWLDYSTWVCLSSVLGRSIRGKGKHRVDMAEGCTEKIDLSFYRYTASYRKKNHRDMQALLDIYSDKLITFNCRSQCQQWLDSLV